MLQLVKLYAAEEYISEEPENIHDLPVFWQHVGGKFVKPESYNNCSQPDARVEYESNEFC